MGTRRPPSSGDPDDADGKPTARSLEQKPSNGGTVEHRCIAIFGSGKRQGEPCERLSKAGCDAYCGLHKRRNDAPQRKQRKNRRSGDEDGEEEVAQYFSDPEGDEYLSDGGSAAELPGNEQIWRARSRCTRWLRLF